MDVSRQEMRCCEFCRLADLTQVSLIERKCTQQFVVNEYAWKVTDR